MFIYINKTTNMIEQFIYSKKIPKNLLVEGSIDENYELIQTEDFDMEIDKLYFYENGNIIIKNTVDTLQLEEQIECYKNLIIEKTKEIELIKLAGFGNENLELELNELKKQHLEKSHELALQIESRLRKEK